MPIDITYELWSELKRFISTVDRNEAADILVNVLIDHDFDAEEIKHAFKGDNDVRQAVASYLDDDDINRNDDEDIDNIDFEDNY